MILMDFTTTAMARPEIVDATYASFSKKLEGLDLKRCRLFINIDPLPEDVDRMEVVKVAEKYFKEVYYNCPEKPNYTAAYNWIWSNAETKYIFNLEDDWELLQKVSIPQLLKNFEKHPKLMEVALRAYPYQYKKCPTSPSIMHERYYKAIGGKLDEAINPEAQLRGKNFGIEMPAPEHRISWQGKLVVHPKKNTRNSIILKDIGRDWLEKSGFMKPRVAKANFVTWTLDRKTQKRKKKGAKTAKSIEIKKDERKMDALTPIAKKYRCDKGSIKHRYTKIYNNYFYGLRNKKFNILEIGFGKGASAKMWLRYFKKAMLYYIDIIKEPSLSAKEKRFKFIKANQSSTSQMSKLFEDGPINFGVIIDDGSHVAEDEMVSFGFLFPHLLPGGLYVIEDLDCRRGHNEKFDVEERKVIEILKEYKKTGNITSKILTEDQLDYINKNIANVEIYNNKIAFIKKVG